MRILIIQAVIVFIWVSLVDANGHEALTGDNLQTAGADQAIPKDQQAFKQLNAGTMPQPPAFDTSLQPLLGQQIGGIGTGTADKAAAAVGAGAIAPAAVGTQQTNTGEVAGSAPAVQQASSQPISSTVSQPAAPVVAQGPAPAPAVVADNAAPIAVAGSAAPVAGAPAVSSASPDSKEEKPVAKQEGQQTSDQSPQQGDSAASEPKAITESTEKETAANSDASQDTPPPASQPSAPLPAPAQESTSPAAVSGSPVSPPPPNRESLLIPPAPEQDAELSDKDGEKEKSSNDQAAPVPGPAPAPAGQVEKVEGEALKPSGSVQGTTQTPAPVAKINQQPVAGPDPAVGVAPVAVEADVEGPQVEQADAKQVKAVEQTAIGGQSEDLPGIKGTAPVPRQRGPLIVPEGDIQARANGQVEDTSVLQGEQQEKVPEQVLEAGLPLVESSTQSPSEEQVTAPVEIPSEQTGQQGVIGSVLRERIRGIAGDDSTRSTPDTNIGSQRSEKDQEEVETSSPSAPVAAASLSPVSSGNGFVASDDEKKTVKSASEEDDKSEQVERKEEVQDDMAPSTDSPTLSTIVQDLSGADGESGNSTAGRKLGSVTEDADGPVKQSVAQAQDSSPSADEQVAEQNPFEVIQAGASPDSGVLQVQRPGAVYNPAISTPPPDQYVPLPPSTGQGQRFLNLLPNTQGYNRSAIQDVPGGLPVIVVAFGLACDTVCDSSSSNPARDGFISIFQEDISRSLNASGLATPPERIIVINIVQIQKETVCQFSINQEGVLPFQSAKTLQTQLQDPNSQLRQGNLTKSLNPDVFGVSQISSLTNDGSANTSGKMTTVAIVCLSAGIYIAIIIGFFVAYRAYQSRVNRDEIELRKNNVNTRTWWYKDLRVNRAASDELSELLIMDDEQDGDDSFIFGIPAEGVSSTISRPRSAYTVATQVQSSSQVGSATLKRDPELNLNTLKKALQRHQPASAMRPLSGATSLQSGIDPTAFYYDPSPQV